MRDEPSWLECADVSLIHDEQIALHGGLPGLRDGGALESALARPKNLIVDRAPDIFELAASYAFGLAKGHCFVDGNKRTAFAASAIFLLDHGFLVIPNGPDNARMLEALASGDVAEEALAKWFRERSLDVQL